MSLRGAVPPFYGAEIPTDWESGSLWSWVYQLSTHRNDGVAIPNKKADVRVKHSTTQRVAGPRPRTQFGSV